MRHVQSIAGGNSAPVLRWLRLLRSAVEAKRGPETAKLLDPDHVLFGSDAVFGEEDRKELVEMNQADLEPTCQLVFGDNLYWSEGSWKQTSQAALAIMLERSRSPESVQWPAVVRSGTMLLNFWIELYRSASAKPFNWMIPALVQLCAGLTAAAASADLLAAQQGDILESAAPSSIGGESSVTTGIDDDTTASGVAQEYAQKVLNTIRMHIGKFRGDESRQAGYIVLMGESIKSCMALRNMKMAATYLKTIESSSVQLNQACIPRGPMVSFRASLGQLFMQQEQFAKAEKELVWAFSHCSPKKVETKRSILECLVAVRLRTGLIPPTELLEKYRFPQYLQIVTAIKNGNVQLFDETLEKFQKDFIQAGTLLCLERVKFLVYRTLIQRVIAWAKRCLFQPEQPQNIFPLGLFTAALKPQMEAQDAELNIEFDDEEMACILSGLIQKGYVKGYVAWTHRKIVLSKADPIPRLSTVPI